MKRVRWASRQGGGGCPASPQWGWGPPGSGLPGARTVHPREAAAEEQCDIGQGPEAGLTGADGKWALLPAP